MVLAAFPTEVSVPPEESPAPFRLMFKGPEESEITILVPEGYPQTRISSISISCRILSNQEAETVKKVLLKAAERSDGEEVSSTLFDLIALASSLLTNHQLEDSVYTIASSTVSDEIMEENSVSFVDRCLIHFHHIMSGKKKNFIENEAEALELGGVWCDGFPGCIVVEGKREALDEYLKGLRQLRWQEMTVLVLLLYTHSFIYSFTHTKIYMHAYIRAYIHTYIHTYIHAYTHMYVYMYVYTLTDTKCCRRGEERNNGVRLFPFPGLVKVGL